MIMKRKAAYILAAAAIFTLLVPELPAREKDRRGFMDMFKFGIEGSCIITAAEYRHYNYISAFGYRIDRKFWQKGSHVNGELLIHAGCDITRRFNLSLYTGYSGISRFEHTVPLTLRGTVQLGRKDMMEGRWMVFADAGPGFSGTGEGMVLAGLLKAGAGYRIPLSRHSAMDILLAFRAVKTNTGVTEISSGNTIFIIGDNIRSNDALYMSVQFGIGLTF